MNFTLEKTWEKALSKEFERDYYNQLMAYVSSEYSKFPDQVCPKEKFIFKKG
jgi:uracil DNA glycosylase